MKSLKAGDRVVRLTDDLPRKVGTITSIQEKYNDQWIFVDFEGDRKFVQICMPEDLEFVGREVSK